MKLENKIKKYIKLAKETSNTINKAYYLKKINECKKELIYILCEHNGFFNIYYNIDDNFVIGNLNKHEFIENYYNTYSIKKIYIGLDKNCNTQVINIDFNI